MANKKYRGKLRKLIFNDKYLIVVSLFLAVVVWTVTSVNIGDEEEKTIQLKYNIKSAEEASDEVNMQYFYPQDTVELTVKISGKKYVLGQVDENNLKVKLDTGNASQVGSTRVPIIVSNNSSLDFSVKKVEPSSIKAYYDFYTTKTFDLNIEYDENNVAEGYVFGTPVLSEDKITVSGPNTAVKQINKASLNVDFGSKKSIKEQYKTESLIELEGITSEQNYLKVCSRTDKDTEIDRIGVTIPVLKKVTLPISVDYNDDPEGIDEGSVSIVFSVDGQEKEELEAGILDSANIKTANIGTIDFKTVDIGDNIYNLDVSKLKGITLIGGDKDLKTITANIRVSNSYAKRTISIRRSDVLVEGLKSSQKANVRNLDKYYVTVIMPNDIIASDIELELKVDVSEKSENNEYPLNIKIKNNEDSWVFGDYKAIVDIT